MKAKDLILKAAEVAELACEQSLDPKHTATMAAIGILLKPGCEELDEESYIRASEDRDAEHNSYQRGYSDAKKELQAVLRQSTTVGGSSLKRFIPKINLIKSIRDMELLSMPPNPALPGTRYRLGLKDAKDIVDQVILLLRDKNLFASDVE